jgi:hypothetical protein
MPRHGTVLDEDPLRAAPRSLLADANRLFFDRVWELFSQVRRDCDAAVKLYALSLPRDDGLAAVEFLAEAVLHAVQQERANQNAPTRRRKSGPHQSTKEFLNDWEAIYPREKAFQTAKPATIAKWIAELKRDLGRRKTKTGAAISSAEAKAIRKYIEALEQRRTMPRKKIGDVRRGIAEGFVKAGIYGKPRGNQDAESFVMDKRKRAKRSLRRAKK